MAAWGAGVFTAMFAAGKTAGTYADEIVQAARITNFSAETLQKLKYASQQTNVRFEDLVTTIYRFENFMGSLQEGNKQTIQSFLQLGMDFDQLRNMSPEQMFFALTDRIMQFGRATDRARLGAEITGGMMGRQWKQILPLLAQGREALIAQFEEAKRAGLILSPQQLYMARAFSMQLRELWNSVKGTSMALGSELLPVLSGAAKSLTEGIQAARGWIREHGAMLRNILIGVGAFATAGIAYFALGQTLAIVAWGFGKIRSAARGVGIVLSAAFTPLRWLMGGAGGAANFAAGIGKGLFFLPATIDAYLVRPVRKAVTILGESVFGALYRAIEWIGTTIIKIFVKVFPTVMSFAGRTIGILVRLGDAGINAFSQLIPLAGQAMGILTRVGSAAGGVVGALAEIGAILTPVAMLLTAGGAIVGVIVYAGYVWRTFWTNAKAAGFETMNTIRGGILHLWEVFKIVGRTISFVFRESLTAVVRDFPLLLGGLRGIGSYFRGWGDMFAGLWSSFLRHGQDAFAAIRIGFQGVQDAIAIGEWRKAGQVIALTFKIVWMDIKASFAEQWDSITGVVSESGAGIWKSLLVGTDWAKMEMENLWDAIKTGFHEAWINVIEEFQMTWRAIQIHLIKVIDDLAASVPEPFLSTFRILKQSAKGWSLILGAKPEDILSQEEAEIAGIKLSPGSRGKGGFGAVQPIGPTAAEKRHAEAQKGLEERQEQRRASYLFMGGADIKGLAAEITKLSRIRGIGTKLVPQGDLSSLIGERAYISDATRRVLSGAGVKGALTESAIKAIVSRIQPGADWEKAIGEGLKQAMGGGWEGQADKAKSLIGGALSPMKPDSSKEQRKALEDELKRLTDQIAGEAAAKRSADLARGQIAPGGLPGPDELKRMQMRQVGGFSAAVGRSVGALGPMQQVARNTTEANRHLRTMIAAFERRPDAGLLERARIRGARDDAVLGM